MHELGFEGGVVVFHNCLLRANVYVDDGKISKFSVIDRPCERRIDCRGKLVMHGVVDVHVHFREPGLTHKEDWLSGSSAAAAGGVTTVLEMPNTKPPTTTWTLLKEKIEIASRKSLVDFHFHFGALRLEELSHVEVPSVKFYLAGSDDLPAPDDEFLLSAFKTLARRGMVAAVHAEDAVLVEEALGSLKGGKPKDYHLVRGEHCAVEAVKRVLRLAAEVEGIKIHICHVTCSGEVELLWRSQSDDRFSFAHETLSGEVTPTHLFLTLDAADRLGNYVKVAPPLRTRASQRALWAGLRSGVLRIVASDHAPHTREEKERDVLEAPPGVPGVETMLPLLLNEASKGNISYCQIASWLHYYPVKRFALKKEFREGEDADIIVVTPKEEWVIKEEELHSKCGWSPFDGWRICGRVEKTFVRGTEVYDGEVVGKPGCGRLAKLQNF
ncbi:MAG: Dihydroorotase or related cyclic amidohydrolase [Candidatus Alkanophagales archaeon MCA70_species_1]|nr:Dihydroorotase or related cyclic amidohydrolase [Candidatus Alkanophaga volatiphilum]